MFHRLRGYLAHLFPQLGVLRRLLRGQIDHWSKTKNSYAQHEDDQTALKILREKITEPIFYIDIGANHPTSISNTYLLYRQGGAGICIEPNGELIWLHKKLRPRDIQLQIGCGQTAGITQFFFSKTPVLSSFNESQVSDVWKTLYVPVIPLDTIFDDLQLKKVHFISIDVEGHDYEVLEGAHRALRNTYLVCVEIAEEEEVEKFRAYMHKLHFTLQDHNHINYFFTNDHWEP